MSSIVFSSPPPGWRSCGRPWWPCSSWTRTWAACARGWLTSRPSCRGPSSTTPATTRRFRGSSASSRQVGAAHPKLSAMGLMWCWTYGTYNAARSSRECKWKSLATYEKASQTLKAHTCFPVNELLAQPCDSGWSRWKSGGRSRSDSESLAAWTWSEVSINIHRAAKMPL